MNTTTYLNGLETVSLASIRSAAYSLSVKTGYDHHGRIILFPLARGENVIGKINHEANGLVVHLDDAKVACIAVPMPYLRNRNQMKKNSILDEWNDNTKVYECQEGTNITMYWFMNRWCIATAKGIELNNVKWNNGKTYQEMVCDCVNSDWDSFCADLDKNCSFAFGFCHPEFHVFQDKPPTIWINRITHNETFADMTNDCKLPFEVIKPMEFKNKTSGDIIEQLQKYSDHSLEDYLTTGDVCLGFIIRGLEHGDVLFESLLQKAINDLYYDAKYTKLISQTSYTRHNYVLLDHYIGCDKELFMDMFPKFAKQFGCFDNEIEKLVDALELIYRKSKQMIDVMLTDKYLRAAYEIKKIIDLHVKVNVDDKFFRTTIMAVLYHPDHFDAIYRLLF